jgi:type I restriction enzyme, S subunit
MSFEMTTLGEYIKVQGGYAYKSKDFIEFSYNKVLKIKNVRFGTVDYAEPAYVSDEIAENTKNWKVKEGDVLISMTGSGPNAPQSLVGRVARVWKNEPDAWINQRVGRICLLEENIIHLDFIFYWLALPQSQDYLVSNSSGSANQANISGKIIESLPCPKVDYDTSKHIADFARKLDEKVILNNQTNSTLEEIAQAIFKSWFVDFDPVKAKMNGEQPEGMDEATASLFPEKLVESDLGWVPFGWGVEPLDSIFTVNKGLSYKGKFLSEDKSDVPLINLGNFGGNGKFRYEKVKYYSGDYKPRHVVKAGQLVIANTDMTQDRVILGSAILVPELGAEEYLTTHHTFSTSFKKQYPEDVWKYFVFYSLQRPSFRFRAEGFATGTTVLAMPKDAFTFCTVALPPVELVERFSALVQSLKQKIACNEKENVELTNLRDTLLPKLLSGEIELGSVATE